MALSNSSFIACSAVITVPSACFAPTLPLMSTSFEAKCSYAKS